MFNNVSSVDTPSMPPDTDIPEFSALPQDLKDQVAIALRRLQGIRKCEDWPSAVENFFDHLKHLADIYA